ncbi:hypothetical protein TNCV_256821 [Trichonephila clavipes]|nr:hypothetical protein TNCV_256821 [Trichonephila clavipes]
MNLPTVQRQMREPTKKPIREGAESSQLEIPMTLRRAKSMITTYIGKRTTIPPKKKKKPRAFDSPSGTLTTVGPVPKHLERAEAVARFRHDFLTVYLHWLLTRLARSAVKPKWMATTCFNALDSMNTRLMTPSVGTGWLGVK